MLRRMILAAATLIVALLDSSMRVTSFSSTWQRHKPRRQRHVVPSASDLPCRADPPWDRMSRSDTRRRSTNLEPSSEFDDFDYLAHWYPVMYARDLILNEPTKATLFDQDYVVAKVLPQGSKPDSVREEDYEYMALIDRCPHKSAALSDGRITSSNYFQCAYHGWTFQGTTGDCVEIPQIVKADGNMPFTDSERTCATAVPVLYHQGLLWMFPGGNLETALSATPPPRVAELDHPDFVVTPIVRDFPIDWTILTENIADPDHGAFAHQVAYFDVYTASPEFPVTLQETWDADRKGWTVRSTVVATEKLNAVNRNRTGQEITKKKEEPPLLATSEYRAPFFLSLSRRDEAGETSFVNSYYICPVGTGRSRLMLSVSARSKLSLPRWIPQVVFCNFVDQDTYLLATQQPYILGAEVDTIHKGEPGDVRKNLFVYRSPTEKLLIRMDRFFDATLHRAPNRVKTLLEQDRSGQLRRVPPRSVVLDRESQHLQICPDSQSLVKTCNRIQTAVRCALLGLSAAQLWIASGMSAVTSSRISRLLSVFVKPRLVLTTWLGSALIYFAAKKISRQFYFKYDEVAHRKDMSKIPNVWNDVD